MPISLNGDGIISGVTTFTTAVTGVTTFSSVVIGAGSTAAPAISPSGDSNTGIFFPSPDTIAFAEGGVEAARFDSNGRLGIGTNLPVRQVDIYDASLPIIALHNSSTGSGTNDGMLIYANGTEAHIKNKENDALIFSTNDTERARILAAGGLTFNGDTAAANALDDYEEGSITGITLTGSTGGSVATSGTLAGKYVKIGDFVLVNVNWTQTSTTATGTYLSVNSCLPFTPAGGAYTALPAVFVPYNNTTTYNATGFGGFTSIGIWCNPATLPNGQQSVVLTYRVSN